MQGKPNLVLCGFMGTGKSVTGRVLAQRIGAIYVDSDERLEQMHRMRISEMFAQHGEAWFRDQERACIASLMEEEGLVLSVGGGSVMDDTTRALLLEQGFCVCLTASLAETLQRLNRGTHRPLVADSEDFEAHVKGLLDERAAAYGAIPNRVDTTGKTAEEVADEVMVLYKNTAI